MTSRFSALLLILGAMWVGGCDTSDDLAEQAAARSTPSPATPDESGPTNANATGASVARLDAESDNDVRTIDWDALIPEDWRPETLMADYDLENLTDDDPRAQELLDKLTVLWKDAPTVPELEGQRVRLPGFVVPLEMDDTGIEQFLLGIDWRLRVWRPTNNTYRGYTTVACLRRVAHDGGQDIMSS